MLSGCVGLAGCATIVAALAAKARSTGGLFAALGLPVLFVFLCMLINAAATVYATEISLTDIVRNIGGLLSFGIAVIAISVVTFKFVWEE